MFLILHGAEDEGYPLSVVDKVIQELRAAKVPFQYEVYSGAGHGFSSRRTRTRSAPTRSRSPRPRERSRNFSACEGAPRVPKENILYNSRRFKAFQSFKPFDCRADNR